jgi:RNA polymerase sigma-70 factor (ECF subfamily)
MRQLFDIYYAPLCGFAGRYTGNSAIAEEIVSDVMSKLWQRRKADYRAANFREYLYAAVRNTAVNYLKQQHKYQKTEQWEEELRYVLIDETPLDMLIADELQTKCEEIIQTLPEQCRKAFQLSRFEELTYEEIAVKMHVSVNTVKHHIKAALSKIRHALSDFMIWL